VARAFDWRVHQEDDGRRRSRTLERWAAQGQGLAEQPVWPHFPVGRFAIQWIIRLLAESESILAGIAHRLPSGPER
jgi:hypothetical protein